MGFSPPFYEFIDHTGDLGIRLKAPTLEALFETAAQALFKVLAAGEVEDRPVASVAISAPDRDALLVDWLNELVYLHTVGRWLLRRFRVTLAGETRLQAEVGGELFDPTHHQVEREVKAATFHGLKLSRVQGAWQGQVIFDL